MNKVFKRSSFGGSQRKTVSSEVPQQRILIHCLQYTISVNKINFFMKGIAFVIKKWYQN